jgi:hypothetical protein
MRRSFSLAALKFKDAERGPRFWLQIAGILLALLNGVALFLYLDPPGGSRAELTAQSSELRREIQAARANTARQRDVAAKVQTGNQQSGLFQAKYFLAQRTAYEVVIAEIQRIAKASGLTEKDSVYAAEPIEGTLDLSLLNITSNYEVQFTNLLKFLNEVDHSPMLLMLDALQAAPQARGGQINASIRFQAIVQEDGGGMQP